MSPRSRSCGSRVRPTTSLRGALCARPVPRPLADGRRSAPGCLLPSGERSLQPQLSAQQKLPLPARAPGLGWSPARPTSLPGGGLEAGRARLTPGKVRKGSARCPTPRRCRGTRAKCRLHAGFVRTQRAEQRRGSSRPRALPTGQTRPLLPRTPRRAAGRPGTRDSEGHGGHLSLAPSPRRVATTRSKWERQRWRQHCG